MPDAKPATMIRGAEGVSEPMFWTLVSLAGFGGWSALWAVFWFAVVLIEYNRDSAADEEFAGACVASVIVALGASVGARILATGRGVDTKWPAGFWIIGYVSAVILLGLYLLSTVNGPVEG
jgi:hypothetical protein